MQDAVGRHRDQKHPALTWAFSSQELSEMSYTGSLWSKSVHDVIFKRHIHRLPLAERRRELICEKHHSSGRSVCVLN